MVTETVVEKDVIEEDETVYVCDRCDSVYPNEKNVNRYSVNPNCRTKPEYHSTGGMGAITHYDGSKEIQISSDEEMHLCLECDPFIGKSTSSKKGSQLSKFLLSLGVISIVLSVIFLLFLHGSMFLPLFGFGILQFLIAHVLL